MILICQMNRMFDIFVAAKNQMVIRFLHFSNLIQTLQNKFDDQYVCVGGEHVCNQIVTLIWI